MGRGLRTCTPKDLLVYFRGWCLPRHGELVLTDGQRHASPCYLNNAISHLSTLLGSVGRCGPYNPESQVSARAAFNSPLH